MEHFFRADVVRVPAPASAVCPECQGRRPVSATIATGRRTYRYDWHACPVNSAPTT
jgi:hypothetical protein